MSYIKLLKESYLIGLPLGTTIVMLYLMIQASFNEWTIILDFNRYGEGKLELLLMILWVVLYLEDLAQRYLYGKTRTHRGNKKVSNIDKDARKQYINL